MKKNLGQLLVEHGLVNEKTLGEALQRQVIFGGRLGTNLLEMGAIAEEDLMKLLALQYNVPYAQPIQFEDVSRQVLDSVPEELLSEYRIFPLALDGQRITLAMTDPHKLDIVDEVAFKTDKVVEPVVASEVRILGALEKYYRIRREARYIAVSEKVASEQRHIAHHPVERFPTVPLEEEEMIELTEADMEPYEPFDVRDIDGPLLAIRNRDEVAQTVIKAGMRFMDDVFMFMIKGDEAMGWMSGGPAKPSVEFGTFTVPMDSNNILHLIRESRTLERFKGVDLFESNQWMKELSLQVPKEVVICPLVLKKHVVSAIVGFSFEDPITEDDAAFLVRVMQKASVAFEILIMKSRIIML